MSRRDLDLVGSKFGRGVRGETYLYPKKHSLFGGPEIKGVHRTAFTVKPTIWERGLGKNPF